MINALLNWYYRPRIERPKYDKRLGRYVSFEDSEADQYEYERKMLDLYGLQEWRFRRFERARKRRFNRMNKRATRLIKIGTSFPFLRKIQAFEVRRNTAVDEYDRLRRKAAIDAYLDMHG